MTLSMFPQSHRSLSDRLRIAFVADTVHSGSTGGGVASGEYVVNKLRETNDVTTVATDGDDVLPGFQLPFRAMREAQFMMAKPDRSILFNAFANVDVVHLQLPFWLSFAALDEAKRLGLPVVAGFHVQPENALFNVGIHSEWLNKTIYRALVKHFYNKVDAVICPTKFAEEKLLSYGLKTSTYVVSNGVPPDVAAAMANVTAHKPRAGGKFFILAVGRLAAEKRQEVLIEAVRRSKHANEIRLVLSGGGPREAELKRLASELPNGAEIGFLPRATLLEYFKEADLFVHSSDVELEGMSVLESMSAGLPAIIAQAPESAASAFALNDDFKYAAGDVATLTAKIDALIENPEKLEAAREPYRQRARQFDFEASVGRMVEIYRSVVGEARALPSVVNLAEAA
jgi:glycosyltransferase involved in cell wall biosynthesis